MSWKNRIRGLLVLRGPRQRLAAWRRARAFDRAMRDYLREPDVVFSDGGALLRRFMFGWGNDAYVSEPEFLRASLEATRRARSPVVECGSGLSTVLIGVMAMRAGVAVVSLEDHPVWAERVRNTLAAYGLDSVTVDARPLKRYGEFDWYDPDWRRFPERIGLLLCDGPHGRTFGGRYGALPVLRERLAPGGRIILDDADRQEECEIAARWASELGTEFTMHGDEKPYIVIDVPRA